MRIKMHPDRLKKPGMTEEELKQIDEEAGRVGQAAELLTNPSMVSVSAELVDTRGKLMIWDSGENTIGSSEGAEVDPFLGVLENI